MSGAGESRLIGIDVGGANLKYADTKTWAFSRHFEMWRTPEKLAQTLAEDLARLPAGCDALAVTMTGELADCFVDRGEGVRHIVEHVCEAAASVCDGNVWFYGVDGRFSSASEAITKVDTVAAANWHALANLVAAEVAADALLIDVGSTTTDVIPIRSGRVETPANTDHQRLIEGSLVYVGCRRTPVCGLVDHLTFRGRSASVMNELFATIDDARIVLGFRSASADDHDSADGRPRTKEFAANRLARMIGLDRRDVTAGDARELAEQIHEAARQRMRASLARWEATTSPFVISGHGDDLIDLPAGCPVIRLQERLGPQISRCAPSYAVARLLQRTGEAVRERCAE